ncbi:hypothetical protein V8E36_004428 [Tilletia maclaganii]
MRSKAAQCCNQVFAGIRRCSSPRRSFQARAPTHPPPTIAEPGRNLQSASKMPPKNKGQKAAAAATQPSQPAAAPATSAAAAPPTASSSSVAAAAAAPSSTAPPPTKPSATSPSSFPRSSGDVLSTLVSSYQDSTPAHLKLIDGFMAFLVLTGVIQFGYCVAVTNFPFNSFIAGFASTVGQFVLAASLRIQANTANSSDFPKVSPERAFADFLFGSVILHFFVINFLG